MWFCFSLNYLPGFTGNGCLLAEIRKALPKPAPCLEGGRVRFVCSLFKTRGGRGGVDLPATILADAEEPTGSLQGCPGSSYLDTTSTINALD